MENKQTNMPNLAVDPETGNITWEPTIISTAFTDQLYRGKIFTAEELTTYLLAQALQGNNTAAALHIFLKERLGNAIFNAFKNQFDMVAGYTKFFNSTAWTYNADNALWEFSITNEEHKIITEGDFDVTDKAALIDTEMFIDTEQGFKEVFQCRITNEGEVIAYTDDPNLKGYIVVRHAGRAYNYSTLDSIPVSMISDIAKVAKTNQISDLNGYKEFWSTINTLDDALDKSVTFPNSTDIAGAWPLELINKLEANSFVALRATYAYMDASGNDLREYPALIKTLANLVNQYVEQVSEYDTRFEAIWGTLDPIKNQAKEAFRLTTTHAATLIALGKADVTLNERLIPLEEACGGLENTFKDINDGIAKHEQRIGVLEETTARLDSTVAQHTTAIKTLEEVTIPSINAEIEKNTSAITTLNDITIPNLSETVNKNVTAIAKLDALKLSDVKTDLTNLQSAYAETADAFTTLQEQVAPLITYTNDNDGKDLLGTITYLLRAVAVWTPGSGEEITDLESVTAAIVELRGITDTFSKKIDNNAEAIKTLQETVPGINEAVVGLQVANTRITGRLDTLEGILGTDTDAGTLQAEVADLKTKYDTLWSNTLTPLQGDVADLNTFKETVTSAHAQYNTKLATLTGKDDELEKAIGDLDTKYTNITRDHGTRITSLETATLDLATIRSNASTAYALADTANSNASSALSKSEKALGKAKEAEDNATEALGKAKEALGVANDNSTTITKITNGTQTVGRATQATQATQIIIGSTAYTIQVKDTTPTSFTNNVITFVKEST